MNPVTLKELRQLTRSRTIAGAICGFFLVLLNVYCHWWLFVC